MKKFILFILAIAIVMGLSSCGDPYVSSYRAVGLVRNNTNRRCSAEFHQLDGTCVFKLKKTDGGEGELHYTASLEEGEINVYYDIYGTKELLFNLKAGETAEDYGGYIESGKTIYVILETVESSKGSVQIDFEEEQTEEET